MVSEDPHKIIHRMKAGERPYRFYRKDKDEVLYVVAKSPLQAAHQLSDHLGWEFEVLGLSEQNKLMREALQALADGE